MMEEAPSQANAEPVIDRTRGDKASEKAESTSSDAAQAEQTSLQSSSSNSAAAVSEAGQQQQQHANTAPVPASGDAVHSWNTSKMNEAGGGGPRRLENQLDRAAGSSPSRTPAKSLEGRVNGVNGSHALSPTAHIVSSALSMQPLGNLSALSPTASSSAPSSALRSPSMATGYGAMASPFGKTDPGTPGTPGTPTTPGRASKRGPYRCGRCGQLLKGHTCPFKDYAGSAPGSDSRSPRTPLKGKRPSESDLEGLREVKRLGDDANGTLTTPRRQSMPSIDELGIVDNSHLAALQLLSIQNHGTPPPTIYGDPIARFIGNLQRQYGIPKEALDAMFHDELQRQSPVAGSEAGSDEDDSNEIVSDYTFRILSHLVSRRALLIDTFSCSSTDANAKQPHSTAWQPAVSAYRHGSTVRLQLSESETQQKTSSSSAPSRQSPAADK